jgi:hypothetical protein
MGTAILATKWMSSSLVAPIIIMVAIVVRAVHLLQMARPIGRLWPSFFAWVFLEGFGLEHTHVSGIISSATDAAMWDRIGFGPDFDSPPHQVTLSS